MVQRQFQLIYLEYLMKFSFHLNFGKGKGKGILETCVASTGDIIKLETGDLLVYLVSSSS